MGRGRFDLDSELIGVYDEKRVKHVGDVQEFLV
jgi:hypothetical protein